jgi:abortive infection bacteriophage resistance protein
VGTENGGEFTSPALTIAQLIDRLAEKGFDVSNTTKVTEHLTFIGYHRLSAYFIPFKLQGLYKKEDKKRYANVEFDKVVDIYIFDRKLRLLVLDAIERIEVSVKAVISKVASEKHGPHWFLERSAFSENKLSDKIDLHTLILDRLDKDIQKNQPDISISNYHDRYSSPSFPPSWMIFETLSLGTVSLLYQRLATPIKGDVAKAFSVSKDVLESWLRMLTNLRNLCAHHSRLWNRSFSTKPEILNSYKNYFHETKTFFAQFFVVTRLLKSISRDEPLEIRLEKLIMEYPDISISRMGFPQNWTTLPIWNL